MLADDCSIDWNSLLGPTVEPGSNFSMSQFAQLRIVGHLNPFRFGIPSKKSAHPFQIVVDWGENFSWLSLTQMDRPYLPNSLGFIGLYRFHGCISMINMALEPKFCLILV
jgi:hypothetical protein